MTEPTRERRTDPRATFSGIALVHTPGSEIHCIAGNLSASGILIFPQRPAETPAEMRVTFALPTSPHWIELGGTLVHQQQVNRRPAWGVRFDDVPGEVRHQLQRYVATVHRPRQRPRMVTPPPVPPPVPPAPVRALSTPPPIPKDADDEDSTVTVPGTPFEEPTNRLPADEARLLTSSLRTGNEPPTRRTSAEEVGRLKDRCRDLN